MNRIYQKDCESSCEFVLPDYMGDVKKLLTVSVTTVPTGKFVGNGEVQFSGIVNYSLLYSDSEGKLTNIKTSSDYEASFPISEDAYTDSYIDAKISNYSTRLTGPRKIALKSIVSLSMKLSENEDTTVGGDAYSEGNSPEELKAEVISEKLCCVAKEEVEYAEEAERITGVSSEEIEIISTSGAVRITESTPVDMGVRVKGEVIITAIVRTEEQPPFAIKKIIPFEETIDFSELTPETETLADAYITSVGAGASDDGDDAVISVNAAVVVSSLFSSNEGVSLTKDSYLKSKDTECRYKNHQYTTLLGMKQEKMEIKDCIKREEIGIENINSVLFVDADIRALEKEVKKDRIDLSFDLSFFGVASEVPCDTGINYIPIKFTKPYKLTVKPDFPIFEGCECDLKLNVVDIEHSIESNKLSFKVDLTVSFRIYETKSVKCVTECFVVGEENYDEGESVITVYYPEREETLFEIAKKFHTTAKKIAEDNDLTEGVIKDDGESLLINGVKKIIIA